MPKLKTHKGASARFEVTGTGKLRRMKGSRGHMRRKKSGAVKRLYAKKLDVSPSDAARIRRIIPT
ncbi:MAG: 50S ribosomal protein L35 [SAR202 cluster bacterium]|nr:50S ribosomal protein L35 [SAR202 cluster bacterium]